MKLSIRMKFLFVMSGLLIVCLSFYLLMSITVFKSDKTNLVYDLNRSQVSNLASEIETTLNGVSETMTLFAQLPPDLQNKMIQNLYTKDSDIISLSIFKDTSKNAHKSFSNERYFETYGLKVDDFFILQEKSLPPFSEINKEGEAIWNASVEGAPPLMGYGKLVLVLDDKNTPVEQWVLVSYIKLDSFLKSVSILSLSEIQISNSGGEVLVQRDAKDLQAKPSITNNALFQKAVASNVRLSVSHINHEQKAWLAAFAKAFNDRLIVTAKSPEKKVFEVVRALTVRTLLFGSIVLTLVILVAFLLSRSLTQNIALLAKRMISVSQEGDLTSEIHLRGNDETISLANAFNKMIHDLKQSRDELEIMNRDLDQKVKDRTAQLEIQNRKVVEAQEALVRTARLASMGEVAGRTAHEVLNPLTSLLTRAGLAQKRAEANYLQPLELLEEISNAWDNDYNQGGFDHLLKNWQAPSTLNPDKNLFLEDVGNISEIKRNLAQQAKEIAKDMQFIREEGDRIGKIIHGMRRLGNLNSEIKNLSAHALLQDCCDIMADLFDQQRIKLATDFTAAQDNIRIDRDEFIQSVTNLMRNALQSMIEVKKQDLDFKAKLTIYTTLVDNKICIDIEDNGMGIDKVNQDQLFKLNFTTKPSDEGTGLGLSISRRFIRNYDGEIEFVESQKQVKTVFRIKLPIIYTNEGKAVA